MEVIERTRMDHDEEPNFQAFGIVYKHWQDTREFITRTVVKYVD